MWNSYFIFEELQINPDFSEWSQEINLKMSEPISSLEPPYQ